MFPKRSQRGIIYFQYFWKIQTDWVWLTLISNSIQTEGKWKWEYFSIRWKNKLFSRFSQAIGKRVSVPKLNENVLNLSKAENNLFASL